MRGFEYASNPDQIKCILIARAKYMLSTKMAQEFYPLPFYQRIFKKKRPPPKKKKKKKLIIPYDCLLFGHYII